MALMVNRGMRFPFLLILVALLALGGCAEAVKNVSYTLPPTPGGRMCSHQCVEAQDYCHQACDLHFRQCVTDVQARAISDYDKYTRDQFLNHGVIDLRPSDFERQTPCADERKSCAETCDRHYQTCFGDCGGTVNVTSSCQFLCF